MKLNGNKMTELGSTKPVNPAGLGTISLLLIASVLVFLDQLSKYLCNTQLTYGEAVSVFPGLDLLLVYNTGAAFSFLGDAGGWQRWLFSGISLVVSGVVCVWLVRLPKSQKLLAISLAFILGGAVGNLYDRVVLGHVIDFISVYFGPYRFAIFNVADSAISVGFVLMAIDMFIGDTKKLE